jgi:lipopolysaccharide export system permease protein
MLKYLDEIVGKDLDTIVILELIFYFSIFMTPNAFPLAVLLSSLMTFGNLGQHFELTALKGAGISLIRVLVPIFIFTLFLTGAAYYSNNFIVPKANLKAFSLLYDVKQMKPSMELKEGAFYNGIEGYSIKVGQKLQDGKTLKDILIYDHTAGRGNRHVTMADSGKMYNILNDRYLVLEMFNGKSYREMAANRRTYSASKSADQFLRNEFKSQKVVFSLASFDLKRTKEELFASNRLMKNSFQLKHDVDSMKTDYYDKTEEVKEHSFRFFDYHLQDIIGIYKERALEREREKRELELQKELEYEIPGEEEDSVIYSGLGSKTVNMEKKYDTVPFTSSTVPFTSNKSQINSVNAKSQRINRDTVKLTNEVVPKTLKRIISAKDLDTSKISTDRTRAMLEGKNVDKRNAKKSIPERSYEENIAILDSILATKDSKRAAVNRSLTHVRFVKNNMIMRNSQLEKLKSEINKFQLERFKKLSYAVTILIMFFIGAPLGSIIKRGGLGVPVLISISFFILFYIISMICEKYTRTDMMDPFVAAWMANFILLPIGIFFMKQARNDARLFDMDFYNIILIKVKTYLFSLKSKFIKSKSLN